MKKTNTLVTECTEHKIKKNDCDLTDKRIAVILFAFVTMMLAFASLFLHIGVGCFLMTAFFIVNSVLIFFGFELDD